MYSSNCVFRDETNVESSLHVGKDTQVSFSTYENKEDQISVYIYINQAV